MKPVLLVRNDPFETFGVAPGAFAKAQMPISVWEAVDASPAPDLEEVGGLIVFGSSYNVEHADEHPFIHEVADLTREAVDRRVPTPTVTARRGQALSGCPRAGTSVRSRRSRSCGSPDGLFAD